MRKSITIAFMCIAIQCMGESVEYVVLTETNTLAISENQSVAYMIGSSSSAWVYFGATGMRAPMINVTGSYHRDIDGPVTVALYEGQTTGVFKIVTKDGAMTPSGTIVIPADHKGPVHIKLECSSDMVNWTDATPGIYQASVSNRFFRIKGLRQAE